MKFKFNTPEPANVTFTKKGHKYRDQKGKEYVSVTTLLKEYYKPFDTQYWSTYKGCKDVLERINLWSRYKQKAGGWQMVVEYFRRNGHKLDAAVYKRILDRKQWYITEWKNEGDIASILGNKQHDTLEKLVLNHKKIRIGSRKVAKVSPATLLDMQGFVHTGNSVHPELLLWNEKYRLAGQADLVEKEGNDIVIKDYKTCKEIKMEPFMGTMMKEPLQYLPDTDYSKFTMQLSTYGWMLEQLGYTVRGIVMIHIHRVTGEIIKEYPMAYRPDLVEQMLENYERKRIRKFN